MSTKKSFLEELSTLIPEAKFIAESGKSFEIKPIKLKKELKIIALVTSAAKSLPMIQLDGDRLSIKAGENFDIKELIITLVDKVPDVALDITSILLDSSKNDLEDELTLNDISELLIPFFVVFSRRMKGIFQKAKLTSPSIN